MEGHALAEEHEGRVRVAVEGGDVEQRAAVLGAFQTRSAEFIGQEFHDDRFTLLGRDQHRRPVLVICRSNDFLNRDFTESSCILFCSWEFQEDLLDIGYVLWYRFSFHVISNGLNELDCTWLGFNFNDFPWPFSLTVFLRIEMLWEAPINKLPGILGSACNEWRHFTMFSSPSPAAMCSGVCPSAFIQRKHFIIKYPVMSTRA